MFYDTIIYVFKLTPRKKFFHIPSFNIPHISSINSKLEWNLTKCNVMLEQMMSKHARLSNDPNDRQQLRNIMVLFLHYCSSFLFYSVSINLKCVKKLTKKLNSFLVSYFQSLVIFTKTMKRKVCFHWNVSMCKWTQNIIYLKLVFKRLHVMSCQSVLMIVNMLINK